ncbi:MAG: GAF domain-containing protein [Terriglobales bacterium]
MPQGSMPPLGPNPAEVGQPLPHPHSERRRRVRHKLHLPAYVRLNSAEPSTSDLCEIIDLSEDGMAIQTASPLELGRDENWFLDLPETDAAVQTAGTVIWSDTSSGRVGVHFRGVSRESLQALKKWLFADALAGCLQQADEALAAGQADRWQQGDPDHTSVLTALAAVRKEVEALGRDLDAALQLIARRAQVFTHSTAAAIGLAEGSDMVCRATAGPNAPSVGTRLRVGSGFSGECVRSGILLRCDDSETDPRVDRDSCRALGIRSMIAAPIRSGDAVTGIIEVFSPQPNIFRADHELVLRHLTEITSAAMQRASALGPGSGPASAVGVDDEFPVETPADLPIAELSRSHTFLAVSAVLVLLLALLWVTQPWVLRSWVTWPWTSIGRVNAGPVPAAPQEAALQSSSAHQLEALEKLAANGDPAAQFDLGVRYSTGDQVPQDYAQAVRLFSLSAEQGSVAAQAMLGNCYAAGRGIPPDPMRAYFWTFLAQDGGDEASKSRVALYAAHLTAGQIALVHKEAGDWLAAHPRLAGNSHPEGLK